MALRVSTTGSDVPLNDLGILIEDPTSDRDLADEFTSEELKHSEDLTLAIQNGDLTVNDGQFEINPNDYNTSEVLNQELQLKLDRRFISHDELSAGYLDTPIEPNTFPLTLNSTASTTRNVYVPAARWGTWQIDADDKVVIDGSSAADGIYTVESISDHQNFIVVESIADSTGGDITVYHPNAAERIGVDDTPFSTISGQNLQEILDDVDNALTTGGFSDQLVKVSSNDTTADYLGQKIIAGSNKFSVTEINDGNNEDLSLDVNESNINHDNLSGFVINEHIDWTQSSAGIIHPSNYVDNNDDEKAKVSANDTTSGYLNGKLIAGTNVTFTENNDGGNETLEISCSSSSSTFGSQFQQVSNLSFSSTTSTCWQQKLRLTTEDLPEGLYRIGWRFSWQYNSTSYEFLTQVEINNSDRIFYFDMRPTISGTSVRDHMSSFGYRTLSGVNTIDLDYKSENNCYAAYIGDARIEIWRVS